MLLEFIHVILFVGVFLITFIYSLIISIREKNKQFIFLNIFGILSLYLVVISTLLLPINHFKPEISIPFELRKSIFKLEKEYPKFKIIIKENNQ